MNVHLPANRALAERLRRDVEGEVLFDRFSRGRYSTDASIYQIEPVGVVIPKTDADVQAALRIAREEGVPVLARGGGTSQSGQTVGRALVVDYSKYLNRLVELDAEKGTCIVEPGIVLDELNRQLKATGWWFPVDVSTASRATLGGMTGNNSCGTRSLRYGIMRDNVLAIDALLADGAEARFAESPAPHSWGEGTEQLFRSLTSLGEREATHIAQAFPAVSRRVGGYLIDALVPGNKPLNLATLLVGSEGTLALSRRIEVKLARQPRNKALGICHFPQFRQAMEAAQHIVKLGPVAVEVVDRTLIELARDIAMFRPVMDTYVRGKPDALLLTEFAEDDQAENLRRLDRLEELMGDLGHPGSVVKVADAAGQKAVWEVRAAGLNIMMSMKSEGKPVSFIEDCAVPLEHLADYTERLTAVFEKHGTRGTWYAHASVGCLHVRPVLNLKLEKDVNAMRAIAEEAFALVKEYKGAHSGEHGDGLVRSEFHELMYGRKTVELFEEVKDSFDPQGLMNPGKIVRSPRMNDRTLLRYKPDYRVPEMAMALDWSAFPGAGNGFQGAVEMCNNNGECRKLDGGVMCPSYRVTRNERDVTRGRANTLRLAISGQLGPDALASDEMLETLKLCVSCKACRRECPTGVDMARMKIEVLAAAAKRRGVSLRDRLIAYLPRYAPYAARLAPLMNARNAIPCMAWVMERLTGFTANRKLPHWTTRPFSPSRRKAYLEVASSFASPQGGEAGASAPGEGARRSQYGTVGTPSPQPSPHRAEGDLWRASQAPNSPPPGGEGLGVGETAPVNQARGEVALFADSFNRYFEPENLYAAIEVLEHLGYRVHIVEPVGGGRPVCCGRTFLSAGLVDEARTEAQRLLAAVRTYIERGVPVVGLEPSCLLTLKDEIPALLPGEQTRRAAATAFLLEDFLARELDAGRLKAPIGQWSGHVLLHGHCHQKSFGAMPAVGKVLAAVEGLNLDVVQSSCCGMAGAFGYAAETYEVSKAMGELSLLPAVRKASSDTIISADGFSCRHQIKDGTGREARHVARLLRDAVTGMTNGSRVRPHSFHSPESLGAVRSSRRREDAKASIYSEPSRAGPRARPPG